MKYNTIITAIAGGGGGRGDYGGGGGEVFIGNKSFDFNCLDITIGAGGSGGNSTSSDGGYTCISHNNVPMLIVKPGRGTCGGNGSGGGSTTNGGGAKESATANYGGKGVLGYGGGGGGRGYCGVDGGGNGSGCNATNCGGGGGGGNGGGMGGGGMVEICYKPGSSSGINCATGGTVTTSGDYTVHTFTSDGTFTIVS